jgi:hypothetical protein
VLNNRFVLVDEMFFPKRLIRMTSKLSRGGRKNRIVRKVILATTLLLFALIFANAQVPQPCRVQDEVRGCSANGRPGQQTCDGHVWGYCKPNPPPPPPAVSGVFHPKYYILTLIYAPPGGVQFGQAANIVKYGSSSTTGTTVDASSAFNQAYTVSASVQTGFIGTGGLTFGYTRNSLHDNSEQLTKTAGSEIDGFGPPYDGINHDLDLIYLWLNPTVDITLHPGLPGSTAKPGSIEWHVDAGNQTDITYVYVGWLKNPSQMPPGELQLLQNHGITPQDFAQMQKADPFAHTSRLPTGVGDSVLGGNRAPDPKRFLPLFTTFPYEPPFQQGGFAPTLTVTLTKSLTDNNSSQVTNQYTVGVTVSAETDLLLVKDTLQATATWQWTDINTTTDSAGTTESATVTITGPGYGYQGPTDMAVYYDVLYKTFLFAPVPTGSPSFLGSVSTSTGKPVSGKEVIVVANGVTYHTFTNAKGQYRVFGNISGPVQLKVDKVTKQLPPQTREGKIVLP